MEDWKQRDPTKAKVNPADVLLLNPVSYGFLILTWPKGDWLLLRGFLLWLCHICRKKPFDSKEVAQKRLKDKSDVLVVLNTDVPKAPSTQQQQTGTTTTTTTTAAASSSKDFADQLREAYQHLNNGRKKVCSWKKKRLLSDCQH